MESKVITIDAKDKVLGRLASEVALHLRGKNNPAFERNNINAGSEVCVFNVDFLKFTGNKLGQKLYRKHTGYAGGLKSSALQKEMEKDSTGVFRKAVSGMLPKNKLREQMLKKLKIFKQEIK